jgi:hypothetical protein
MRPGHEIQIADDAFRVIYNHLEAGNELAKNGVDLFISSNGGSDTVPWRIVSLIHEYANDLSALVPYHAFSAATLIALGTNKIVMHKTIDPSVWNLRRYAPTLNDVDARFAHAPISERSCAAAPRDPSRRCACRRKSACLHCSVDDGPARGLAA